MNLTITDRELATLVDKARAATSEAMKANLHNTRADHAKAQAAEEDFETYYQKLLTMGAHCPYCNASPCKQFSDCRRAR